jgi:hypothetical protein
MENLSPPQTLDLEKLKAQNFAPFCDTPHSRVPLRGKTKSRDFLVPPFDRKMFERDLGLLLKDSKTLEDLFFRFQLMQDTYLYPASVISLVVLPHGKQKSTQVLNAQTYAGITRAEKDWNLNNKKSLGHYLAQLPKHSIVNFPDTTGKYFGTFMVIPKNWGEINQLPREKFDREFKKIVIKETDSGIQNFDLVRKEARENPSQTGEYPITSCILAPLWSGANKLGYVMMGLDFYHAYTGLGSQILSPENFFDLQKLIAFLGLSLGKVLNNYEDI